MRPMSAVAQAKVSLASHLDRQMDELMGGTKGAEDELAAQFEALQATLGGLAAAKTEPGDRGLSAGASAGAGRRGRSDLLQRVGILINFINVDTFSLIFLLLWPVSRLCTTPPAPCGACPT